MAFGILSLGLLAPSLGDDGFSTMGFGMLAGMAGSLIGQTTGPNFGQFDQSYGFDQMSQLTAAENAFQNSNGLNSYLGQSYGSPVGSAPAPGYANYNPGGVNGPAFQGWSGGRNSVTSGCVGNMQNYANYYGQSGQPTNYGYPCQCQLGGFQPPLPGPPSGYFQPSPCNNSYYLQQQQQNQCYGGQSYPVQGQQTAWQNQSQSSSAPSRAVFQTVPQVSEGNYGAAASIVNARVVGSDAERSSITLNGQADPSSNFDGLGNVRTAVWSVMQQDNSLCYNADNGEFFRSYADGSTRNVMNIAQASTAVAQAGSDPVARNQQVNNLLGSLPSDNTLFGINTPPVQTSPTAPPSSTPAAAPQYGVPGVSTATQEVTPSYGYPQNTVNYGSSASAAGQGGYPGVTPLFSSVPYLPTSASQTTADPAKAQQLLTQLQANSPNLTTSQFLDQALAIRENLGTPSVGAASGVQGLNGQGGDVPFSVNAHAYYNTETGQTVPVSEVDIHESGNYHNRQADYNVGNLTNFEATKPDAKMGQYYQVAVTWQDGASRTWDYQVNNQKGTSVDIFGPLG